jgi:hypothetical protein
MTFNRVLLPEPFAPIKARTDPLGTEREAPDRALNDSYSADLRPRRRRMHDSLRVLLFSVYDR